MSLHTAVTRKSRYLLAVLIPLFFVLSACSSDDGNIQPTPQTIVSVSPASGSSTALITTTVSIQFGVDMDEASVESLFTLEEQGGGAVAASVNYDAGSKLAVLTPSANLTDSTGYTATLSSDVLDAAGAKPLTSNYVWSFSTAGAGGGSAIDSVSPAENSETSLVNTTVTVVFSIDMSPSGVLSALSLSYQGGDVQGSSSYDVASRTLVFTPNSDLVSGGLYTATVDSAVQDTGGGTPLPQDFVWSFTIAPATIAVSTDANDVLGNNTSSDSDIDSEGRYVVFVSRATNLTSVNSGGIDQVYRKDTQTGEIAMASTDASGLVAGNAKSSLPTISGDGQYVAFVSEATDLVAGFTYSALKQVYLKNMTTGAIVLLSRESSTQTGDGNSTAPSISGNGQYVAFQSLATNLVSGFTYLAAEQIYSVNTSTFSIELLSRQNATQTGNGDSVSPSISADGQYVAFQSSATNLVSGFTYLAAEQIYSVNTSTFSIELLSRQNATQTGNGDSVSPSISADGQYVAFQSSATNLVAGSISGVPDVVVSNTQTFNLELISDPVAGDNSESEISTNGRYLGYQVMPTSGISQIIRSHNTAF